MNNPTDPHPNEEAVGNNDLRYDDTPLGGFHHVMLRDADDGDVIIVNEDDLIALRDRLDQTIKNATFLRDY